MRLWLAIALTFYSLASYFTERILRGDWANWNHAIGALALAGYLTIYYRAHRDIILTGFYQIYYSIGMLLSAALVSSGMFMFEIAAFGDQNGIFWVMMTYTVAGLEASGLGYRLAGFFQFRGGVRNLSRPLSKSLILLITTGTTLISLYVFISYRGPILVGTDRVTFWRELVPPYLSFLPTLATQSFFFVAFYYLWSRQYRQKSALPTVILFSYILTGLFVLGQKFSLFILFLTIWFALLPGMAPNLTLKRSHILALLSAVTLLVASVLVSYTLQDKEPSFALARIALQAQVLWSVFDDAHVHILWPGDLTCYFGCGPFADGKDFISYKYLPFDLYNFYSDGGTTLSGFMPALSIMTLGIPISLLLHLTISFILGIIQKRLVAAVSKRNIFSSFLLYKTHISITLIWFAALQTAIPGLISALLLIVLYRFCFPITTANKRGANVHGVLVR